MNRMFQWAGAMVVGLALAAGAWAEDQKDTGKSDTGKKDDKPFTDAEFVKKVASSGMHEVELGKLAAAQAKSDDVKKFGQKMVADHTKANEELKAAAKKANTDVPAKMEEEHQKHVEMLKGMKGEEFDRAYMKHMVESHTKAVALFTQATKEAKDAGLKDFATKTLPVVQGHLDMAKKMDKGGK